MLLAIDVGNTNITLGVYDGESLKMTARIATESKSTADCYAVTLKNIIELKGLKVSDIDGAIIGSVVPAVGSMLVGAIETACGISPVVLGPGVKTGINIVIDNPGQLGADLAAGAAAALAHYDMPCIIFDLGTATTASVMDKNGAFLGGAIAAGLYTTLNALTSNTAALPGISIEPPKKVIGSNTVDSMRSGLIFGAASMIDGMIERIEEELGEKATVIATGGLSSVIVPLCKRDIVCDNDLLLEGLRLIYNRNRKKN